MLDRVFGRSFGIYLAGAASASLVDHHLGLVHRFSLRTIYILFGLLLMGRAIFMLRQVQVLER